MAPRPRVVGLLLAAGRGRRFAAGLAAAGAAPLDKLLVPVDGEPVARRALRALASACDTVVAAIRPDASDALRDALAGARAVECAEADRGMGDTLAAAARAAAADAPDLLLVMPADLPWVDAGSVRAVVDAALAGAADGRANRIVVPVLADGRRGHPVAFGAAHLAALARLSGEHGARSLLEAHPPVRVVLDDAGILRDVDTPRDLPPP